MTRLAYTETVGSLFNLCFDDHANVALPVAERSYPVIVTKTQTHVIWVEADSPEDAVDRAEYRDFENLQDDDDEETCVSGDTRVEKPGAWDWMTVTRASSHGYPGTPYDAHIDSHRALLKHRARLAAQAECAATTGHADRRQWVGMSTCNLCNAVIERDGQPVGGAA